MSETLDKELDNMEQVDEGSNPVTKNAKPGEKMDASKSGVLRKSSMLTPIPKKVLKVRRTLALLLLVQ